MATHGLASASKKRLVDSRLIAIFEHARRVLGSKTQKATGVRIPKLRP
jgi:hypothetical protein